MIDAPDVRTIRCLLENIELKIVLDSSDNAYRVEYFTTSIKDRQTGQSQLTRTYRLLDRVRGGITPEPWDAYDLDKQAMLITDLIRFSRYRVTKIFCGWEITCPACGHISRGKIWKAIPKICAAKSPRKCRAKIDDKSISEVLFTACATQPSSQEGRRPSALQLQLQLQGT